MIVLKKYIAIGLITALCLCLMEGFICGFDTFSIDIKDKAYAATPEPTAKSDTDDYDKDIKKAEEARDKAKAKASAIKEDLQELLKNKGNILKFVKNIDKKVDKLDSAIDKLDKELGQERSNLDKIEEELTVADNVSGNQYEKMKKRIKYIYENGTS